MTQQATTERLPKLYPYTEVNPFDSWFKRMRLYYLGETTAEMLGRESLARDYQFSLTKSFALSCSNSSHYSYISNTDQ
jgi:hypothetical protein